MKTATRLISFFVAAAALVVTGCDKTIKPAGDDKTLSVAKESIAFEMTGGSEELEISASSGLAWRVSADADWVKTSPAIGSGIGTVIVSVEANTEHEPRTARITVTAEGVKPAVVSATQASAAAPSEDAVKLKTVNCYYAGDYWGTDGKLDDVYFEMTDMTLDEGGSAKGPGTAIRIDMNVAAATFDTFSIEGTYTPSAALTPTQKGTFNVDAAGDVSPTYIYELDANGAQTRKDAVGGKIVIVKSGENYMFDIELTFLDKTSLKAVYNGAVAFYDDTIGGNSTLTESISPSFTSVEGTFYSWGMDGMESDALILNFTGDTEQNPCDYMTLTLNIAKTAWNSGNIDGTYKVIEKVIDEIYLDELVPGTAIPGYLSKDNSGNISLGGGWYYALAKIDDQSQLAGMAPFTSGTVTISGSAGNGDCTVGYSFVDDNPATPHTISGKYTGKVNLTNVGGGSTDPTDPDNPDPDNPDPDKPDPDNPDPDNPDPDKPDPDKPDPDKPDPDEPAKPLIDIVAGGNLGQFTGGGRW